MKKNTPEALIDLFEELKNLLESDTSLNNQNSSQLQEILTTAIIRVKKSLSNGRIRSSFCLSKYPYLMLRRKNSFKS